MFVWMTRVILTWLQVSKVRHNWCQLWVIWQLEKLLSTCLWWWCDKFTMNLLSNSSEWWVTNKLTVFKWCGNSVKVSKLDWEILVLFKTDKINLTIYKFFTTFSFLILKISLIQMISYYIFHIINSWWWGKWWFKLNDRLCWPM